MKKVKITFGIIILILITCTILLNDKYEVENIKNKIEQTQSEKELVKIVYENSNVHSKTTKFYNDGTKEQTTILIDHGIIKNK